MKFIRHGESEANLLNLWGGNYPLTENGRNQALAVPSEHPSAVVVSELIRAQETAKLIFPNTPFVVDKTFNEINFGNLEDTEIDFQGEMFRLFIHDVKSFCKRAESDDIDVRAKQALLKAQTYPKDTVFVTHGTLMQAMRSLYKYGTIKMMHYDQRFGNCECWKI